MNQKLKDPRIPRRGVLAAVLLVAALLGGRVLFLPEAPPSGVPGDAISAQVVRVVDGDTIDVDLHGERRSIRYLGIDAPEMDWESGDHQVYAPEATAANRRLVEDRRVWLTFDEARVDRFDRLLAHVYTEDVHVNRYLVRQGYAEIMFIEPNLRYFFRLLEDQRAARAAEAGLWATVGAPVSLAEAPAHVGAFRAVEGRLEEAVYLADAGLTLLEMGGEGHLTIRIYPEFRTLFAAPPESLFAGEWVRVTGLIERRGGDVGMVVRDPQLIEVLPMHPNSTTAGEGARL